VSIISDVAKRIFELQDSNTIAIHLKAENYFDTIRSLVDNFATKNDLGCIYVTFTIPSQSIIGALEALEVDMKRMSFIDGISNIMMSSSVKSDKTIFIESATMLEYLMLKIEFILRRSKNKRVLVILDSINSLAIHNSPKILSEFLHILSNHLRTKDSYFFIFSMEEYETEEVRNMLNIVCEENFSVSEVIVSR
jgi:KaiC/GvpD/RAD55 family RecA-like ATPase